MIVFKFWALLRYLLGNIFLFFSRVLEGKSKLVSSIFWGFSSSGFKHGFEKGSSSLGFFWRCFLDFSSVSNFCRGVCISCFLGI